MIWLDQEPNSLRTLICPALNASFLLVSYENDRYGTVQMLLTGQRGTVLFDEQQTRRKCPNQLDLASLQNDVYTPGLQTPNARHTQYVPINTITSGRIVLNTSRSGFGTVGRVPARGSFVIALYQNQSRL